jgi:hypothetical protein
MGWTLPRSRRSLNLLEEVILQSVGGLPHDMPRENFHCYKDVVDKIRKYSCA